MLPRAAGFHGDVTTKVLSMIRSGHETQRKGGLLLGRDDIILRKQRLIPVKIMESHQRVGKTNFLNHASQLLVRREGIRAVRVPPAIARQDGCRPGSVGTPQDWRCRSNGACRTVSHGGT